MKRLTSAERRIEIARYIKAYQISLAGTENMRRQINDLIHQWGVDIPEVESPFGGSRKAETVPRKARATFSKADRAMLREFGIR